MPAWHRQLQCRRRYPSVRENAAVRSTVTPKDFAGLRHLRDRLGALFKAGVVLYTGERTLPFGDRLTAVPLCGLWQEETSAIPPRFLRRRGVPQSWFARAPRLTPSRSHSG
jgi:hypothetical protein